MWCILNLQVIILTVEVCNIIADLTKHVVKDYEGIENLMDEGNANRWEISEPVMLIIACKGIASITRITEKSVCSNHDKV